MKRFLLILQDNHDTNEIDVGGVQEPEQFDETSPAHVVGGFIRDHLEEIIAAAQAEQQSKRRLRQTSTEKTILLPSGDSVAVSGGAS